MKPLTERDKARFWSKVDKADGGCWLWLSPPQKNGYGMFMLRRGSVVSSTRPHRVSWELSRGPIAPGLTLDHLCRNRLCVNPEHLEPVTVRENTLRGNGYTADKARQTHCKYGHPLSGDNLKIATDGHRRCRTCLRRLSRNSKRRSRSVADAGTISE